MTRGSPQVLGTLRTRPQLASPPVQLSRNSRGLSGAEDGLCARAASPSVRGAQQAVDLEPEATTGKPTAVVIHDYRAQGSDELSLSRGDTIQQVELGPTMGSGSDPGTCWLRGELRGCVGLFRSTHVHVLHQDPNIPADDPLGLATLPGASRGRGVCHDPPPLAPVADAALDRGFSRRGARGVSSMLSVGR